MSGNNREKQQDRSGTGKVKGRNKNRSHKQLKNGNDESNIQAIAEHIAANQDYKLDWFCPTENQMCIENAIRDEELDIITVQGSTGTGKSTTAIAAGLKMIKSNEVRRIVFVKTPSEDGEDKIGYLSGDQNEKLEAHFEAMRSIFHTFMSKEKLKLEEKAGRINFAVPNYIAGKTLDDTLLIIDEGQKIAPPTIKLLLERLGEGSTGVLLGDKFQCYAKDRRPDGFTDFVNMTTKEEMEEYEEHEHDEDQGWITVVKERPVRVSTEAHGHHFILTSEENMRSRPSRRVAELYENR